ncbi:sigma 54-interacting transcriptional regulator [Trichlorobacter lovleyi]|uniref:Cyclic nucleotide-binding protein n=1 Tax=Trichlorobacter lovleyi (strain ATCC BAA-1151 / DSM 17278 / SZ) TaxID=398767 RepID=B3E2Y0_TRIL1|nr:sigma 54-interacting transcriptional regulator [Trichlorobacter lovleyi]ACD97240.1 cyclic nucleotide-binding protein [Trichlorobacter lovleyi SZ]
MPVCYEDLAAVRIFAGLSPHQLERISQRLQECVFLSGMVILSRNAPPEKLYLILEGRVRVELQDGNGQIFNVTELGRGEIIGERAILTGEARTADVRAISEVRAVSLGRSDFEELLHETPQIYANLCRILAYQLGSWAQRHQREEREHRDAITNVIGWQLLPEFGAFPGNSSNVRALNARLEQLGRQRNHVLITGEPGTWKDLAARLIHFHADASCPVLFLDCATPPPVIGSEQRGAIAVKDALLLEIAQEAALFGHVPDGAVYARRIRRGMLELAAGGDLILRNVDCLTPAVQELLAQFMASGQFKRRGEQRLRSAEVRIIATSSEPLAEQAAAGSFHGGLYRRLATERLEMAPLRERKKDIPLIARSLLSSLNAKHHKQVRRISQDALNRLVDHDWPLNGSELYQVMSRAVVVCNADEIQAEHIFLQGQSFGGRFNLLSLPSVERLARRPDFPRLLRWTTVPLFLLVTGYTLAGPRTGNAANLAVWTLWWPALLATAFLVARGWCSYCPLEAIGEFVGVKTRVTHEPMQWLKKWGAAISLAGMILILLVEQATGMFSHALATGILLAGLLAATAMADLIIGRRGWCKFLCPLGRIVSLVSRISLLEMHSNRTVCVSRCRVDDCVKERGCPMGLHPTGIDNSDHCVLCLNCVRSCPHHSMQLDLRNPAWGLLNRSRHGFYEALFSVALCGTIAAAKGTPLLMGRAKEVFPSTVWSGPESALAVGMVLLYCLAAMACSGTAPALRRRQAFTVYGLAYLPLAITGLFMIYFRALVEGGAQLIPLLLTAFGLIQLTDPARLTPELGTLRLLIYPGILAGMTFSLVALASLQRQHNLGGPGLLGHRLLLLLTTGVFLVIL